MKSSGSGDSLVYGGNKRPGKGGGRKAVAIIIMILVIAFVIIASLVGFITDYLWFREMNYTGVFWKKLITELKVGIPVFLFTTLLVRLYLRSLRNGYFREIESHEIPDLKRLKIISWSLSGIFALLVAIYSAGDMWMNFLQFAHSTKFNLKDPIFGIDTGFYVFKLEFLAKLNTLAIGIIIGAVLLTVLYYGILMTVRTPDFFEEENHTEGDDFYRDSENNYTPFSGKKQYGEDIFRRFTEGSKRPEINRGNFRHLMSIASGKLTILGVVLYIMVAVDFFLNQFDLLHAHTGTVYGAGFTDVNVTLWVYRLIMAASVVGAVFFVIHMHKKEYKKLLRAPVAIVAIGIAGVVAAMIVQSLVVAPDEINKESKYLKNNIQYTQHAYDIDKVKVKSFPANESLDEQTIKDNSQTIGNIRINDYEPVQDFYNQTQSIRQYYEFHDVDIDRYNINGEETQTYLSPREIDENKISSTWLNRHIKYTHGYGAAVSQVDKVTASGQPDVVVKNIPPETSVDSLKITRPEIYFGELTNDYAVVNTNEKEFNYPDGNNNKYTKYKGNAGIRLTPLNRLLFSMREGSMQLLVSSNVNSRSRIIINRNIEERVKKIMPYLKYESDPYMTIVGGRLYWIVDAYTTSQYYPYSEPYSGKVGSTNYIRNSIKVTIDAYNGDVNFYVIDNEDPIAETYKKIYPDLFKNISTMPEGLREHIRYPNNMFKIQASVYEKYHMNQVKVFYQKEDLWDIAHQIYGTEEKQMDPSYYIFRLPGEKNAEFINMVPFTPKSKQNMTALMMARNDGENYGQLLVYKFPKSKTVYGPMQIEAQIDQNTEISKEFSLWNSSGSKYRRGDLFVIPIKDSLMYVEPVYLEASNQAIPEMKRVIVAYGDRISYSSNLEEALEDLFGGTYNSGPVNASGGTESRDSGKPSLKTLAKQARDEYDAALDAQKNGDWKGYGDHINKLSGYLDQMESAE